MATIKRIGFGQVEPNHLSGQRNGKIYAQLPAAATINILENGQFAKYDYAAGEVNYTGEGEFMLVYNEEKLYEGVYRETRKDFAMIKEHYTPGTDKLQEVIGVQDGEYQLAGEATLITHDGYGPFKGTMYPRLYKTDIGDIITTNCFGVANTSGKAEVTCGDVDVNSYLAPSETGYLTVAAEKPATGMVWKVVKVYTMPDGQPGVKIQRIQ